MDTWRFRRSKQIAPAGAHWARFNFSRRGIGVRVGPRNLGMSLAPDGSQRLTASIPNTGISYTERLTASGPSSGPPLAATPPPRRKFLGIGCLPLSLLGVGGLAVLVICSTLSRGPVAEDDRTIAPTFTATPIPAVAATVAPTETPLPLPTETPLPAAPAVETPLPTPTAPPAAIAAPTHTPVPTAPPAPALVLEPTATTPVEVRSVAIVPLGPTVNTANANLRGGPGTEYATVGSMTQGQGVEIVGRNEAGDWYQLAGGAWIAAFLVNDAPGDLPIVSAPAAVPVVAAPAEVPAPTPEPARAEEVVVPIGEVCLCDSERYNCTGPTAFQTHSEAQSCFDYCMQMTGKDIHGLDGNNDGVACENP